MSNYIFQFGTKADNLVNLKKEILLGEITEVLIILVGDWEDNKDKCIKKIIEHFPSQSIIIRSSAPLEDSHMASMAGAFQSVANVNTDEEDEILEAMNAVINSYYRFSEENIKQYQILIQPMVANVVSSGVIFTRELGKLGPYYIINYDDESGRTDSVTSGNSINNKLLTLHRSIDTSLLKERDRNLIHVAKELEDITKNDSLDIEFIIDRDKKIHILQVRPLVRTRILLNNKLDQKVNKELLYIENLLNKNLKRKNGLFGETTIYGQMPDWNPAEIIGSHPKPLDASLYRFLIMKDAWREGRAVLGYNNPFSQQLLVMLGGRGYVDVRNSFNSLIPKGLPATLSEKLVNYYISELEKKPELHDKVEFEIVISCLTFDFKEQINKLRRSDFGFEEEELGFLENSLINLTNSIIKNQNEVFKQINTNIDTLLEKRKGLNVSSINVWNIPYCIEQLLEDCIRFGTIPFSTAARCSFIGSVFLSSLKNQGIFTEEESDLFLGSINTVASEMLADLDQLYKNKISEKDFLELYGHLRPGTYDITSYSYRERPEMYLDNNSIYFTCYSLSPRTINSFTLTVNQKNRIEELIDEYGFTFNSDELLSFIQKSIETREYVKFQFTKSLSDALQLLAEFGEYHGFTRDDLSFLEIYDILFFANSTFSLETTQQLKNRIEYNRSKYDLESLINLPDIIIREQDIKEIHFTQKKPNFITQNKIVGLIVCLDNPIEKGENQDLKDKIVLIENADPGYDWIFGKKIRGLITKYGGAASHMAIRCSEFGLPAAIGCGEQLYEAIKKNHRIQLNCLEKKIEPYGGNI